MGQWADGTWYPGVIDRVRYGLVHVAFDDGDTMWAEPQAVSRESDPPDDQGGRLRLGSRVTARWHTAAVPRTARPSLRSDLARPLRRRRSGLTPGVQDPARVT